MGAPRHEGPERGDAPGGEQPDGEQPGVLVRTRVDSTGDSDRDSVVDSVVDELRAFAEPRPSGREPEGGPPAVGQQVGRYVILERVGAGGMGVVYAAYDPKLDRKVAVKLLADRHRATPTEEERERLVAEAQALARLNHPNVVAVHDVGVDDRGHVFVAMEYVRGQTLSRWRVEHSRTSAEIIALLVAAGRGLAAAHAEGIVHRDFKPDNVLVQVDRRGDERPRVLDFGLAMQLGDSDELRRELQAVDTSFIRRRRRSSDSGVSSQTPVSGTPAYMAPEQYLRLPGDERSDQFSFCVTAWEMLYGERPFAGDNRVALATAIVTGPVVDPPAGADVDRAVERALRRGLSKEPEQRWPSIDALLRALQDDSRRRGRRAAAWFGGIGVIAAVAGWAGTRSPPQPCVHGATRAAEAYGDDARAAIRASFRATGLPYAEQTAGSAIAGLDAYATQWSDAHRDACEATHVRLEQSERGLDVRMACLQARLDAMSSTVALMQDAQTPLVRNAIAAVDALPSVDPCASAGAASVGPAPPDDDQTRVAVNDVLTRAAQLHPLSYAGRAAEARDAFADLHTEAEVLGYRPLVAELLLHLGHAQSMAGDAELARTSLRGAAFEALAVGHTRVQAEAASLLVRVVGIEHSDYDTAQLWADHATAAVARLEEPGRIGAVLSYRKCRVSSDRGDVQGALPHCHDSVRWFAEHAGPDHLETTRARQGLALAFYGAGRLDEAEPLLQTAYEAARRLQGPDHPSHTPLLGALAAICYSRDRGAQCVADFERAYQSALAGYGPRHPAVADYANNLALALMTADRIDDAESRARQALGIREAIGAEHPGIAASHRILSQVATHRGDLAAAKVHLDAAIEGSVATRGARHPDVVEGYRMRAELALRNDDAVAAIADYEAALRAREGITIPAARLGQVQWGLGRTLLQHDVGRRVEAVALVRQAQDNYAPEAPEQVEIEAWLSREAVGVPPPQGLTIAE